MRARTAGIAVGAVLVVASLGTADATAQHPGGSASRTALSAANPDTPGGSRDDEVIAHGVLEHGQHARTAAQASATCAGCDAAAGTGHVVIARAMSGATADNAAVAWANADGADATAVSVQVLLSPAKKVSATLANRALALTAARAHCRADAAAVQLVLVAPRDPSLTPRAQELVDAMPDRLAAILRQPPHAAPAATGARTTRDRVASAVDDLRRRLSDLQGGTTTVSLDVHTSG